MLKKINAILFSIALVFIQCSENNNILNTASSHDLSNSTWETIDNPESVGWSTAKLQDAYEYSQGIQTAAVMVIYQGKVLYHWGEIARKFNMHSCRKSLLSALIGIHVDEGNIDIKATMKELEIDDLPPSLSEQEKAATVRMLLQSRSGIYHPAAYETSSMKANRPARESHAPGTFWYYNNWDFNTLCTIFEQRTQTKIFEEFKRRIADPIGMEDFEVNDAAYVYENASMHPAYPFRMTACDMARFGLLFLGNGMWEGKRIISEEWVRESTTSYTEVGSSGGYGYMWWVAVNGNHIPSTNLGNSAFSARGFGGHFIVVIPDLDLVVVHRVNTDILNRVSSSQFGALLGLILDAKVN
ncbi:MAG: serine hydrolase [Pseudomonadales bacterium]